MPDENGAVMKRFLPVMLVCLATGCSSLFYSSPPKNLNNACSIVKTYPSWLKAMRKTERRWGPSVGAQLAFIYQESRFRHNARPPYRFMWGFIPLGRASTALGYAQVVDGTWAEYKDKQGRFFVSRKNFADSVEFMGWYMDQAKRRAGIPMYDVRGQYLAYHEGIAGYSRRSYRKKGWLMAVATEVASRARMYDRQVSDCRVRSWRLFF